MRNYNVQVKNGRMQILKSRLWKLHHATPKTHISIIQSFPAACRPFDVTLLSFLKLLTVASPHGNQSQNAPRLVVAAHKSLFDTVPIPLLSSEEKTALDRGRKLGLVTILNVSRVACIVYDLILWPTLAFLKTVWSFYRYRRHFSRSVVPFHIYTHF